MSVNRAFSPASDRKPQLNKVQADAVMTAKEGEVLLVSGMAITGKSTLLEVANSIWKRDGFNCIGATLSGTAAEGMLCSGSKTLRESMPCTAITEGRSRA